MRHLGLLPSARQLDLAHRALTALAGLMLGLATPFWIVPRLVEMSPAPLRAPILPDPGEEASTARIRLTAPASLGAPPAGHVPEPAEVGPGDLETALALPELKILSRQHSEGIFFNHASHLIRHFGEGKTRTCDGCHVAGEGGEPVAGPTFERACASCHSGEMERSRREGPGLAFLSLPALDLGAAADLRLQIGAWPEKADGRLTPMMDMLLAGEPGYVGDRAVLEGLDLKSLRGAKPEQMVALERVVWAVKRLLHDLRSGGAKSLIARLEHVTGEPLSAEAAAVLTGRFPADDLRVLVDRQLPGLAAEVEKAFGKDPWKGGDLPDGLPPVVASPGRVTEVKDAGIRFGWYLTGSTLAYRAVVHADPVQRVLIDLGGSLPTETGQRVWSELTEGTFCTRCHQLDVAGGRFKKLAWSILRTREPGPLAHFSHRSHASGETAPGCVACHSVDLGKSADDLARRGDRPASDFLPVHRTECIACHRSQAMADRCTTCHTSYGPGLLNTVKIQSIGGISE